MNYFHQCLVQSNSYSSFTFNINHYQDNGTSITLSVTLGFRKERKAEQPKTRHTEKECQ